MSMKKFIISEEEKNRIIFLHKTNFLTESKIAPVNWDLLTIENGKIKVWHYSNNDIKNGFIKVGVRANIYSVSEFRAWGKPRVFFYATENGSLYDSIGNKKYKYISYIDVNKVYDINKNPKNYEVENYTNWYDAMLEKTKSGGFNSWIYNLAGNKNAPIIISFDDVKISESYVFDEEVGEYIPKDKKFKDYKVGKIKIDNEVWDVYQNSKRPKSFNNLYGKQMGSDYKKEIHSFQFKDIKFSSKYQNDYLR